MREFYSYRRRAFTRQKKSAKAAKKMENVTLSLVFVSKTENGNYVVMQDAPRRAVVVLKNGTIIQKDNAEFGGARRIKTNQFSLANYSDAIMDFEDVIRREKEEAEKAYEQKMIKLNEQNSG